MSDVSLSKSDDEIDLTGHNSLISIFDDVMIDKYSDNEGKPKWKCKWCNGVFSGWNATKAIMHVNKIPKQDIKLCKAKIDDSYLTLYKELLDQLKKKRGRTKDKYTAIGNNIESHNTHVASSLEKHRSDKRLKPAPLTFRNLSDVTSTNSFMTNPNQSGDRFIQKVLYDSPNPNADSKLTMAIADFVHSCGLPFRIISDRKFHTILNLARATSTSYIPPSRQAVSTDLLDLNYTTYMKRHMDKLYTDIEIFGVSFYGDGATIKKLPLINILASGSHIPACVIEIVDCSKHVEGGGKKDASYISSLFRPHIDKVEKDYPNSVDLVYFDGASNVQKAGFVLEAKYPRICVLHGAEHVISLFFNDVFKLSVIRSFATITRRAYRVFGSGAMHAPYWIFQKYSKQHNNGRNIGLIRAAGTRMAGQAIVMIRFLRLKNAIISTINSAEFIKTKVSKLINCIKLFVI
jgi:Protein of unknown function (DUF 659)